MSSSGKDVRRKKCQGEKDAQTNSKQLEDLSRFEDDKHKTDQETVAASDKDVESKNVKDQDFQEITQSTAVLARRSGGAPTGSHFFK